MAVDKAILLVEDNPDEETLMLRAMQAHQGKASVAVARDGAEALHYLFSRDGLPQADLPRFVILDLDLPRLDGFDVIERLRADPRTRPLPVIVFSSSADREDVRRCHQLGANSYVVKPIAPDHYQAAVSGMMQYWLNVNLDPGVRA